MSNEILYFGAVLIGLFDLTCAEAVISIIYHLDSFENIISTIQRAKVLIRLSRQDLKKL